VAEALKKGKLPTGKKIKIVPSNRSSQSVGKHVIANVLTAEGNILNHDALTGQEKGEALIFLIDYLQEQHPDGRWTVMLKGPGLTTRSTFHLHGILPEAPKQVLRFIFNAKAFLTALRVARGAQDWKRVDELIVELDNNLK